MGLSNQEAKDLFKVGLDYSVFQDGWVYPWKEALDGLTAEQAAWRPGPDLMGVWDIVLHTAVWNEDIVERVKTKQSTHPSEGAWPARAEALDEASWQLAQKRFWDSVDALVVLIQNDSIDDIRSSPYGFGDLLCRFLHMAYHVGQIEKIRECLGWGVNPNL